MKKKSAESAQSAGDNSKDSSFHIASQNFNQNDMGLLKILGDKKNC